jgi:hypothetical protein
VDVKHGQNYFSTSIDGSEIKNIQTDILKPYRPDATVIFLDRLRNLTHESSISLGETSSSVRDGRNIAALLDNLSAEDTRYNEFSDLCKKLIGYTPRPIPASSGKQIGRVVNKKSVAAKNMGSGLLEAVYLLYNIFDCRDNSVLVIDEIETAIHPSLLKDILKYFQDIAEKRNIQVILTTHSIAVVNALGAIENTKLFETKLSDASTSSFSEAIVNEIGSYEERHRVLSDLGYSLSDWNVYEGYIITEESSTQGLIQNIILPIYYPKLVGRIGVIASSGYTDVRKKFQALQNLFLFLHVQNDGKKNNQWKERFLVLVDNGDGERQFIEKMRTDFSQYDSFRFTALESEDIEKLYPQKLLEEAYKKNKCNDIKELIDRAKKEQADNGRSEIKTELMQELVKRQDEFEEEIKNNFSEIITLVDKSFNAFNR